MAPNRTAATRITALALIPALLGSLLTLTTPGQLAEATSGASPYAMPQVVDQNPHPGIVETTILAEEATVDIGGGVMANALTFNGAIPGPEFRLTVGQRVIVHFENHLAHEATGIHWHGIELANNNDGTPLTQNQVAPGDSFLYDFVVTRPGIFWYHPHHEFSTNQVFKGMSGSIIVTDPNEAPLIAAGVLPAASRTVSLILNDITVCKAPGSNDAQTYDLTLPWVGGVPLLAQKGPTPKDLCEMPMDNHGMMLPDPLQAGDVPNVQQANGRTNEGQTVLTNGANVGGRGGDPSAPGPLASGASTLPVQPGQGLRLQLLNTAATRFFRLRLTAGDGTLIPLVRIGAEGGLLDAATVEGTVPGGFNFKYDAGEVLLDAADRADLVAAIPASATGVLTLWTEDFQRTGVGDGQGGWPRTPTVPVAHFAVSGQAVSPAYAIAEGTLLRAATGDPVPMVPAPTATLMDPATFAPTKVGLASQNMQFTADGVHPSIDNIVATHDFGVDYALQTHIGSARYAKLGDTLQLTVQNTTAAHHPYHLHGFSIQPISYTGCPGAVTSFTFPRVEFADTVDVPPGCTLTFRIHLEDRPLADGVTSGGGLGRWMIHCHIFFHHHQGMASELVVADATGNERPYVDALDPILSAAEGSTAAMSGTISDPDGDPVTLAASLGTVLDNGDGTWSWSHAVVDGPAEQYVYVTATDSHGNKGQATFILESENVAPTVTLDPAQVTSIDEGQTLSVSATFTDPADDDVYTAAVDFGDGSGPHSAASTLTAPTPPQAGSISASFTYGDNGVYTVTLTVTDEDGAPGTASFTVTVGNVSPDAMIQTAGPVIIDAGELLALDGRATDPGSDDLRTTWSFGDGSSDSVAVSLVNLTPDGPMSPSVQPRDVEHDASHAFADACTYLLSFSATDDDAGSDVAFLPVLVTAAPSESRGAGYWQHQYSGKVRSAFSSARLVCYLQLVGALSSVFDEVRSASTIASAYQDIFVAGLRGSMQQQLDRQLLTAWLNFANGGVELTELVDTNGDGFADATFAAVMAAAESVRLNPASTRAQLQARRDILERVNAMDGY